MCAAVCPQGGPVNSLPTRDGGIKSVELPGIHDHLKGRRSGVLIGNVRAVQ